MQKNFDLLMEKYKKLSLDKKKSCLVDEMKEMIALYVYIAESNNLSIELLKTKEILDINSNDFSDDDYIEALYAYFNILKEVVSKLLEDKYFE